MTTEKRTIDEMRRILLPLTLRRLLNWNKKIRLAYLMETATGRLLLHKSSASNLIIDDFGRITLPQNVMQQLNWVTGDKILLKVKFYDGLVLLRT